MTSRSCRVAILTPRIQPKTTTNLAPRYERGAAAAVHSAIRPLWCLALRESCCCPFTQIDDPESWHINCCYKNPNSRGFSPARGRDSLGKELFECMGNFFVPRADTGLSCRDRKHGRRSRIVTGLTCSVGLSVSYSHNRRIRRRRSPPPRRKQAPRQNPNGSLPAQLDGIFPAWTISCPHRSSASRIANDRYLQPHTSSRLPRTQVGESETAVTHYTEGSR